MGRRFVHGISDDVWHGRAVPAVPAAWKNRTGSPWRDLPDERVSRKGAYSRLRRWALDGNWQNLVTAAPAVAAAAGELGC